MSRKKKQNADVDKIGFEKISLRSETLGWVFAIGLFALTIFFLLSPIGKGGVVGNKIYTTLSGLLGFGYFFVPVTLFFLSIAFARSYIKPVNKIQCFGALIFFLSALALTESSFKNTGGFLGRTISNPLLKMFDVYTTIILLLSLLIASIIVIFDSPIKLGRLISYISDKFKKDVDPLKSNEIANLQITVPPVSNTIAEVLLEKEKGEQKSGGIKNADGEFRSLNLNFQTYYKKPFSPPPLSLLEKDKGKPGVGDVKANANIIKRTLQNFGIIVEMDEVSIGPSVTRYALKPAEGVKLSRILALQNNLELALAAHPVRIEAPIPGKSLVGIEIPNSLKTTVGLATLLADSEYQNSEKPLMMSLGKGISGEGRFANMAKMPHLLIAGATGSGKSVTIHALINSLLFRNPPDNLQFIMIDPKRVELTLYNRIPHLLTPVLTEPKKAILALKWAAKEMDKRYNILEENKVRDIDSYHKTDIAKTLTMPYIVIVIDELADIMQAYPRELESAIVRLAQMSRAVGIHLILSTQRPSVNVITGLIKANIPARIALQVASQIDSRTILDMSGAEKLLGAGDMLFMSGDMAKPVRLQSPYISETEVKNVVDYLAKNYEDEVPNAIDFETNKKESSIFESMKDEDGEEDLLYEEAKDIVVEAGKASTSYLQRKLRIGYARAARLMDILEEHSVIGPGDGAKPREVLIKSDKHFSNETEEFEKE